MGDKGGKRRIKNRFARLPAQNDRFFTVIQALFRHAVEMDKTILMPANQGEKVPPLCEVDIMASGKP